MPDLYIRIAGVTLRSYTLFVALAAILGVGLAAFRLRKVAAPGAVVDACLGALVGAVALGRLGHVALNWGYFVFHADEITRLNLGGMDWHGALLGGLVGLLVAARWRRVDARMLLDAFTPVLPLLALAGWYGCWAWSCGYGAEVDTLARYPAWMVSESRDVYGIVAPRYNTQVFGVVLALGVFGVALLLLLVRPLRVARFWLALGLLAAGMFVVGFWRGDYAPVMAGLRADQWMDAAMIGLSLAGIVFQVFGGRERRAAPLQSVV